MRNIYVYVYTSSRLLSVVQVASSTYFSLPVFISLSLSLSFLSSLWYSNSTGTPLTFRVPIYLRVFLSLLTIFIRIKRCKSARYFLSTLVFVSCRIASSFATSTTLSLLVSHPSVLFSVYFLYLSFFFFLSLDFWCSACTNATYFTRSPESSRLFLVSRFCPHPTWLFSRYPKVESPFTLFLVHNCQPFFTFYALSVCVCVCVCVCLSLSLSVL